MLAIFDSHGSAGSFFVLYDPQASLEGYLEKLQNKKQILTADSIVVAAQVRFGTTSTCANAIDIRTVARNPAYSGVIVPLLSMASITLDRYFTGDRDHSNNDAARKLFARIAKDSNFEKMKLNNYAIDAKKKEVFLSFSDDGSNATIEKTPNGEFPKCFIGSEPNKEFLQQKKNKIITFKTFGTPFAFKATKSDYSYETLKHNHETFIKNIIAAQKLGNNQETIEDSIFVAGERLFDSSYN